MRLAVLLPTLGGGGMERMRLNMVLVWLQQGIEVDLVVSRKEGALLDLVPQSVQVFEIAPRHPLFFPWGLWRYIRLRKPTHILSAGTDINALTLLVKRCIRSKIPTAISFHIHLSQELSIQTWLQRLKSRCFIWLLRVLKGHDIGIIAVSKGVAEDLSMQLVLRDQQPMVIYNPTLTGDTYTRIQSSLNEHPVSAGTPWILYVGRLVYAKGVDMLLDAFGIVCDETNAHLVVLGEGPLKDELIDKAGALGFSERVHWKGFVKNPLPWMRECTVFALPSRNEGLPNVLIEALACGTQIVSTNCPSGPKEILENGKYGQLVPVDDAQAFAEALLKSLNGDHRVPEEKLLERSMAYTAHVAATKYISVIKECGNNA